jgi:hypothetical protein
MSSLANDRPTPPVSSPWATRLWLAAALLAFAATALWAKRTIALEPAAQRLVAQDAVAWGLNACVVLGVAGLAGVARLVFSWLDRRQIAQILGVTVLAWVLCGLAPRTHRIFFDEQIYMQIGQSYAHTGKLTAANYARAEFGHFELYAGETNKQPQGWPYVYGQVARWLGVSPGLGQDINRAAVALGAGLLCLALFSAPWTLPPGAPFAAGLAWGLTPLVPFWGRTASVEPTAATSAILAFCAAIIYARARSKSPPLGRPAAATLLAATTAFAGYFRPESLLVFPLVAVVLWAEEDDFVYDALAWGALVLAVALLTPNIAQLWSMREESWGATDGRRFDLAFLGENLRANGGYFFAGREFPQIGTLLALAGIGWLLARARAALVVLAVWFAFSWGVFIFFYAGGYHYGASNRFGVVSAAPVAIAMGIGFAAVRHRCRGRPAWLGLLFGVVALGWSAGMDIVPQFGREAIEVQEEVGFVDAQARSLPSGSLVISHAPSMWLIEGRNSTTWQEITPLLFGHLHELTNQYPGGIYVHYGFWDNVEPHRADAAARILVDFKAREVARFETYAMVFGIYRLDTPEALARYGGTPPDPPARRPGELDNALKRARATLVSP